jgi:branched-subunit amino acid ABC-type transport system permease component
MWMEVPTEAFNTIWYFCMYSLMAVPLTLSYRISKVLNFAHGVYITIGAYAPILVAIALNARISPFVAVPFAFLVGAAVALAAHMLVFSPLTKRNSSPVTLMIASMGAWIFIKYAFYALLDILQKAWSTPLFYTTSNVNIPEQIEVVGLVLNAKFLMVVGLTSLSLSLLLVFLTRTKLGMALRAIADNSDLAQISGISKEQVLRVTWIISGGIAAISGFIWSLFSYVSPEVGDTVILQVFACSVIGGLTSVPLTVVGALVISSAENLFILVLYRFFSVPLSFRPFLSFLALLITILVRPPAGAGGGLPYRYRLRQLRRGD